MEVEEFLFNNQDKKYKEFIKNLSPTVSEDNIVGVRTPPLRDFAKKFKDNDKFLDSLPHKYYEENQLHSFLLSFIKDYQIALKRVNEFLPYVDNWATCDVLRPKAFEKHKAELLTEIKKWLKSNHTYTIRFAIEMLMNLYLDGDFKEEYNNLVKRVQSDEYYVKMMIAWYFATALAKQYESTIKIIEEKTLDVWTHNKTIQKAIESFRITDEQKTYLRTLKIKG